MKCPTCGRSFETIASHYYYNPSHKPDLSDKSHELIRGLLLGDGHVPEFEPPENTSFQLYCENKEFVNWVDEELGDLSNDITKSEFQDRYSGYTLSTKRDSEINQYRDWYESDRNSYPVMNLSPLEIKMWYVCKGSTLEKQRYDQPYIRFDCEIEALRPQVVKKIFKQHGFDSFWRNCSFRFSIEQSQRMWKFMGDPPPGFESKWPDSDTAE